MSQPFLSFSLNDDFIAAYVDRPVRWGFPCGGGNTLGELTFLTKYSRRKEDGSKERWHEVCRRVVEGMYSILKDHCIANRTPWNEQKAQHSAQDAYERMFTFRWLPPGRGLWAMGTRMVNEERNSAALQNCSFLSTEKLGPRNPTMPFVRLMEMSMLGVGVGFDVLGAGKLIIHEPTDDGRVSPSEHLAPAGRPLPDGFQIWRPVAGSDEPHAYIVEDSREGWFEAVRVTLEAFFLPGRALPRLIFDGIRPAGELIKGFGGTAAGPGPLEDLIVSLTRQLSGRADQRITSTDIADIMNKIGKCVVAGNVRRSAELALGLPDDKDFINLKNFEVNPERMGANGWGHISNNSVIVEVGDNYDHLAPLIAANGEPGLLWLDLCRSHGRLIDEPTHRDYRAAGTNPCAEQTLESGECCTLVETFPIHHESIADFQRTLKHAFMYGKAVTLLATHWPETNEIMQRNRRIGLSVSGLAQFAERHGWSELERWYDAGYEEVQRRDRQYSEWLGVRESIKTTSVKPSGTVSLLAGVTPGVHWPVRDVYIRRMRFFVADPVVEVFREAGYHVEPDVMDPTYSVVVEFPVRGPEVRTEREVTIWEKVALAARTQRHWADNQVSATASFLESERDQIGAVLSAFDGQLKSISFLPISDEGAYEQMPYERITDERYQELAALIGAIDWDRLYGGAVADAEGERFCNNDVCEIPV